MILGVGTDILKKDRLSILMDNMDDPFFQRIYTSDELKEAMETQDQFHYLCGRFASKEAIFKTFKVGGDRIHLKEIEILKNEWGGPEVNLYGAAKEEADRKGIGSIEVSISHETEYVVAYAIAVGNMSIEI